MDKKNIKYPLIACLFIFGSIVSWVILIICMKSINLFETGNFVGHSFAGLIMIGLPIALFSSIFIKRKYKFRIVAAVFIVTVLTTLFYGELLFIQKSAPVPPQRGIPLQSETFLNAINDKEPGAYFITSPVEAGKVEPASYFSAWLDFPNFEIDLSFFYFYDTSSTMSHSKTTLSLMDAFEIKTLPAVIIVEDGKSQIVLENLDSKIYYASEPQRTDAFVTYLSDNFPKK